MKLFQSILNNSVWLLLREILNVFIRIFGVFILLKFITPEQYGVYVIVGTLANSIAQALNMGMNIHIVKYKEDISNVINSFSSFSCWVALFTSLGAYILIPIFSIVTRVDWIFFAVIFLTIPITILGVVPLGLIERALNYKRISKLEVLCQIVYYVVSIPLAIFGCGIWAPIIGTLSMSLFYYIGLMIIADFFIFSRYDNLYFTEIKKFGFQFSFANISYQARSLILPLIITPLTSHAIIGGIALASRIADSLNIFKVSLGRLSISTLSSLQHEDNRFIKAVRDAMCYQIIGMGFILSMFVILSPIFLPIVLDKKWLNVLPLIPFLAFSTLCNSLIVAQVSALLIKNKSYSVALNYLLQQGFFILGVYIFIPQYGIIGYGYALLVSLPAYLILSVIFHRVHKNFSPHMPFIWFFSVSFTLLLGSVNPIFYCFFILPILYKPCREQIILLLYNIYKVVMSKFRGVHVKN